MRRIVILATALSFLALPVRSAGPNPFDRFDDAAPIGSMAAFVGKCRSGDYSYCTGILGGMLIMQDAQSAMQGRAPMFCVPAGVSVEVVRRAVVSWGDAYPQHLGRPMPVGIIAALREAYPCDAHSP